MTKFGRDYENLLHFIQFCITNYASRLDKSLEAAAQKRDRNRTPYRLYPGAAEPPLLALIGCSYIGQLCRTVNKTNG